MRKLFLLVALLFVSAFAHAGTINVTWTNATTRSDGTAMSPVPTRVEYGTCTATDAFGTKVGDVVAAAGAAATSFANVPAGKYCVRARHEDGTLFSSYTAVVAVVMPVAPPNAPGGITVTATL